MSFEGRCHCGAIRFTVDAAMPETAISCNCSHCRAKGFLMAFFPAEQFRLDAPAPAGADAGVVGIYTFNTHKITHRFCTRCGSQPYADGPNPEGGMTYAVNLRCVPAAPLDDLKLHRYDGAAV